MDPISVLRTEIAKLKEKGYETLSVSELDAWIAQIPPANAQDRAFEEWKARAPLEHASRLEMFKSLIESGQTALKSLTTINGGAAVALLAFLGNLLTKEPPRGVPFPIRSISVTMLIFVFGVGLAGAATGARYLTQWAGATGWAKSANAMNWLSTTLGLLSLTAFFVGGWKSYLALR